MDDTPENPRAILEYPRSFRRLTGAYLGLCAVFAALFLFVVFQAIFAASADTREVSLAGIPTFAIILTFHLAIYLKLLRPRAISRYLVFSDRFELHRGKRVEVARYADIAKLFGRAMPFFGGNFGMILNSGEFHVFGATIGGIEHLIDAIGEFAPKRKPGLAELRANLIVNHHGFSRLAEYFAGTRGIYTFFHLGVVPIAFTAYLVARESSFVTILHPNGFFARTAVGILLMTVTLAGSFALMLNFFMDYPTLERVKADPRDHARDLAREGRIFRDVFPVYLFLLGAMLGFYNRYDLNLLSRTELTAEIPHLGLPAGETLWIDGRANCVGCRHSLREGDVVVFARLGETTIGKVVATPGGIAELTAPKVPGRAPASTTTTLPPGKIAVRSNPAGDLVRMIDVDDVQGRVVERLETYLRARD